MYVAVKGGERAILNSYRMLDDYRRGDREVPELTLDQIREQMPLAVSRVMAEGSLYDPQLASLALKQAAGDVIEAVFLLRAYRTTLSRYGYTQPIDTGAMRLQRRISSTFKDVPGGQILGPTYDYTQRLLDFTLQAQREADALPAGDEALDSSMPRVTDLLAHDELIDAEPVPEGDPEPFDLTRQPLDFPASRAARLQNLARADEGFFVVDGLFHAARLRQHAPVRGGNPLRRAGSRNAYRRAWLRRHRGRNRHYRMPDGQPVCRQRRRRPEVHARLRLDVWLRRTQGHVDGAGRPRPESQRPGRTRRLAR